MPNIYNSHRQLLNVSFRNLLKRISTRCSLICGHQNTSKTIQIWNSSIFLMVSRQPPPFSHDPQPPPISTPRSTETSTEGRGNWWRWWGFAPRCWCNWWPGRWHNLPQCTPGGVWRCCCHLGLWHSDDSDGWEMAEKCRVKYLIYGWMVIECWWLVVL